MSSITRAHRSKYPQHPFRQPLTVGTNVPSITYPPHLVPQSTLADSPKQKHRSRTRSSSSEFGTFQNTKFLFVPASTPPFVVPPSAPSKNSPSSPLIRSRTPPHDAKPFYPNRKSCTALRMQADSEDDRDDDSLIYTSWHQSKSSTSLRTRVYSAPSVAASSRGRDKPAKCISTTPGHYGAGETETEIDEPVSVHFSESSLDRRQMFYGFASHKLWHFTNYV